MQSLMSKMEVLVLTMTTLLMKMTRPLWVALTILSLSITLSMTLYKTAITSLMSLTIILVFASGMMVLFIYAASLTPNQLNKMNKNKILISITIPIVVSPQMTQSIKMDTMKTFSSKMTMILMLSILLVSMHAMSNQSFNPLQSMSSTF